jgi:predicted dehydrogenase/threonine dehydrogenase-like Zn-dependent dehydrogenase
MKQILQDARTGEIAVAEVPVPQLLPGCVLVRVAASVVSAGTERASSEFASKSLLQKAKARPDLVRDVFTKLQRDGVASTWNAVHSRLDQPLALGYSSAGTVVAVGEGITDVLVGERVACAGAGYASHAEFACIPRLLLAKVTSPDVSLDEAAFATLGAVALHGVRTAEAKLGDTVAVIGLGLLGQLTLQILRAAGCRVIGLDLNPGRAALALRLGADAACDTAETFRNLCQHATGGRGADAVLIAAETASSEPVNLAGAVARERAIVCAVGTVGMDIQRRVFFEKELDFRISRSYGPGRYDSAFEQKGHDYPIGYVRWTETRNMEAFLDLLAGAKIDVRPIISHRIPVENAAAAYDLINTKTSEAALGVLITYPQSASTPTNRVKVGSESTTATGTIRLGVIGAGLFATGTLLPAIKSISGIELACVCTATGARARNAAEKFGFRYCATDENEILHDESINVVVIATRHRLHARQVVAAIGAGKHVFCEKPLCLTEDELGDIVRARAEGGASALLVGFNRRFSPMALRLKTFFAPVQEPLLMHYRVNAGFLKPDHWTQDPAEGGRILGEVCHFVDFLTFLAGAWPVRVQTHALANSGLYSDDNLVIQMEFANGSQGTITYVANGDKAYSKERVEVFGGGTVGVLEDFRELELSRGGRKQSERSRLAQDKGHRAEWEAFAKALREGGTAPIAFEEIVAVSLATLRALTSRRLGDPIPVDTDPFLAAALSQGSRRPGSQPA